MIAIGQIAPDFTLPRDDGDTVTLSALRPAPVVLYFYPKDDTPGCTTEAIAFSALLPEFHAAGAQVFGISRDSVEQHDKFRCKHDLSVPLLSDASSDVCDRYGTWVEKQMYGKTHMGIARTTVLIDGHGRIARIWPKVKVPGHADAVLEAVRGL